MFCLGTVHTAVHNYCAVWELVLSQLYHVNTNIESQQPIDKKTKSQSPHVNSHLEVSN